MRRREGLELAPLLERHNPRSAFHLPLFTAVVHKYPGMLQQLLDHGLELTPAITTEHMEVNSLTAADTGCHEQWWFTLMEMVWMLTRIPGHWQ